LLSAFFWLSAKILCEVHFSALDKKLKHSLSSLQTFSILNTLIPNSCSNLAYF
jgi:hypothetical protein